jgi:hypothetical protein
MELIRIISNLITFAFTVAMVGYLPAASKAMMNLAVEAQQHPFSPSKWNRQLAGKSTVVGQKEFTKFKRSK